MLDPRARVGALVSRVRSEYKEMEQKEWLRQRNKYV